MRILLVDDDEALMDSLADRLIHQRYAVDIAIDGDSAKTCVDLFNYDLIVLDLALPDGNGIEFCRQFRRDGYANPVMILTAKESTIEKVKALDAGADDYVMKPFDFDELCARIRALLRREHQGLPAVLKWGPLTLDPSTCETSYAQHAIHLTPKEFSIMELFLRHPHQIYSLGKIIEDLWSFEDPPGEDTVRTHVKGLRRKLKAAGAPKDLIQTVYGQGYRLNESGDRVGEEGLGQAELAQAFKVYLSTADQQAAGLEQVVRALSEGDLRLEQQQLGQMNAHKLAGSMGSFGLVAGSEIASEIEVQLRARSVFDKDGEDGAIALLSPQRLLQRVQQLRKTLAAAAAQNSADVISADAPSLVCSSAMPLLVIVSDDAKFTQLLVEAAGSKCCQAHVVSYQQAESSVFSSLQDEEGGRSPASTLLLLDLDGNPNADSLVDRMKRNESLPIMALSDDLTLSRRLRWIQQGIEKVLTRAALPGQVLDEAIALLKTETRQISVAITDDDPQILSQLQKNLEPWGFTMHLFETASALWAWLTAPGQTEAPPDLLVLDITMPEISGIELCKVLRADIRFQALPIIFLTAHQDDSSRIQAFETGADDVIHKAVASFELATRLRNQIKQDWAGSSLSRLQK